MRPERQRAARPEDLATLLLHRLNAGDVDGLVALYEPDALLVLPDGGVARGHDAIRAAYERIVVGRPFAPGHPLPTLRSGELALTGSRLADGGFTTEVARRQGDGTWLWVIDRPGPAGGGE